MISQRLTFENLIQLAKPSGETYRKRTKAVAFNLATSRHPITAFQSVPSIDEVPQAFIHAKPVRGESKNPNVLRTISRKFLELEEELRLITAKDKHNTEKIDGVAEQACRSRKPSVSGRKDR
ncbi:unnamed protein product [Auanema sp. JU1783]|nr:unnamed protein product [Auanema sp. JU1783]